MTSAGGNDEKATATSTQSKYMGPALQAMPRWWP